MTNEQFLEEIIWTARDKGFHEELFKLAKEFEAHNENMSFTESIFQAFYLITKKNSE